MDTNEFKKEDLKELKFLGCGSFGTVYLAEYHGQKYALKKIPKDKINHNKYEEDNIYMKNALLKEIDILKTMSQFENSVKFYLNFEDEEDYIIILEVCDTNLDDLLSEKKKFSSSEILHIMEGLNKPFKYMVNNNLIHRDIKPENIMIKFIDNSKTKYIPKLTDFGISRYLEEGIANTVVGTPIYKAPEIQFGCPYTNEADLFSIGIMMYELYFNDYPFEIEKKKGGGFLKILYKDKKLKDCEDKLLDDLINKLLILDPKKRITWKDYFNHPFFNTNKEVEELNTKLDNLKLYDDKEHKIINVYDYILEKIIYQNNIERENLKEIDSQQFISIDECLLNHKNDSFFILGIIGKYLQQIGISVLIQKDNLKADYELREYHKNIFLFICNSYILKQKYLLDFDLDKNTFKKLVSSSIEIVNFNEKLKKIIMKVYNLKEEELFITYKIGELEKYTIIIVVKSNFNLKLTKEELIEAFEGKDEEFKTLSKVYTEKIIPIIKLSKSMLCPANDNKKNKWNIGEKRGGEDYIPPLGWINYAINIKHCYTDKNSEWISHLHKPGEWSVAYCGLKKSIEQIYENDDDIRHQGKKVGIGVYCPSDPKIMENDTETIKVNEENYKVGFMLRVKPDKFRASEKNKNIWVVNGNDNEFRPYGILIKKI